MNKKNNRTLNIMINGQAGQALILVLVFFLLGSLTLTPVLMHMGTALKTGEKYEANTIELLTADAGIETGLWRIKYDYMGPDYDPFDFDSVWPYVTDNVNGKTADIYVQNVWLPTTTLDSLFLDAEEAREIIESDKLVITGTSPSYSDPFFVKMEFCPAAGDNLTIKSVGVWLPQDFGYEGSCELDTEGPSPDDFVETPADGGTTLIWSYDAPYPLLIDFPNYELKDGIMSVSFSFDYSPPEAYPTTTPRAVAWVLTDMDPTCINPNDVPISWDSDIRYYKVTSTAGDTDITTYESKALMRNLDAATAGDYVAIGNSLMTGPAEKRDTLLAESSASTDFSPIPDDADVLFAYLYWSGFLHSTQLWTDACANFNNLERTAPLSQTRVPTSDGLTGGTWNTAPRWDDVDETTPNDTDYITGTTDAGGYQYFNFSAFTVPAYASIIDVTVYIRVRDSGGPDDNNIRPAVIAGGTSYGATATAIDAGTEFTTYSYAFNTNPRTSAAWTYQEVNRSSGSTLTQFGVAGTDMAPDIDVSMVYAEVHYSLWYTGSGYFYGRGNADATGSGRTLTLSSAVDLSSYDENCIAIAWTQTESGTQEPDDTLYYAFSGDDGATWSENYVAFSDDSPTSAFFALVPADYLTGAFKFRLYNDFDAAEEYVRLDNIYLYYVPPDDDCVFKIENEQVYLDANGDNQTGAQPLTASFNAVLQAPPSVLDYPGYFYACYRDVTKLVKAYPSVEGETHHTGNANYTVGGVNAATLEYVSYAGWSLIIIYGSPKTAGHYLYLWDIHDLFTSCPQNGYLDFDHDGLPGGDITGFTFPDPIKDDLGNIVDTVAARLTCFVTEGDSYTGDSIKITGEKGNWQMLSNPGTDPEENVWNSISIGMSETGVDVDTYTVEWETTDNIFTPGDTRVNLYMDTGMDVWNLIYIMMSVRSETDTRGTGHYVIGGN
jgi:hypothetical protein